MCSLSRKYYWHRRCVTMQRQRFTSSGMWHCCWLSDSWCKDISYCCLQTLNVIPNDSSKHLKYMPSDNVISQKAWMLSTNGGYLIPSLQWQTVEEVWTFFHWDTCKICNQPSCMETWIYWSVCDNKISVVEDRSKCVVVAAVVVAIIIVAIAMAVAVGVIQCVEKDWNMLMPHSTFFVLLGVNL